MTDKKSGRVENPVAGVVVKDDGPVFRFRGEERVAEILAEEFGAGQEDGFVFFPSAQVEQARRALAREGCCEICGFDHHAQIVLVGREDVSDDFGGGDILVSGADFGYGLGLGVSTAGAAADVVAGEEGALRTGKGTENLPHRSRGGEVEQGFGRGDGGSGGHVTLWTDLANHALES